MCATWNRASHTCLALHSLPNDASHRYCGLSLLLAMKPDGVDGV